MRTLCWLFAVVLLAILIAGAGYLLLIQKPAPEEIRYGVSFNTPYARELGLDWDEVYRAILEDLHVKRLRLAAHWDMVEPADDEFNFAELDRQIALAAEHDAEVILAIGRRLPRWPECHVPAWAQELSWEEQKGEIEEYLAAVVKRYKDEEHIAMWQVENEPFLTVFAHEHCGDLDEQFLDREIAMVRELDPSRPILMTDSGNLGLWSGAYRRGDAFGTSVYLYLWNPDTGPITSLWPAHWYRAKERVMELLHGDKPTILIELSAEPWLLEPVTEAPLELQLERMNEEKFEEIIQYARKTRLPEQYLWGAEWWYWLKERHDHPAMWERGKVLFNQG